MLGISLGDWVLVSFRDWGGICSLHLSLTLFRMVSLIDAQWLIQCACGFRDRGRVVFFAPTVALVRQQHEEFKRWFSALKVDYLVGPELEEKAEINVMLKDNQVKVCLHVTSPSLPMPVFTNTIGFSPIHPISRLQCKQHLLLP